MIFPNGERKVPSVTPGPTLNLPARRLAVFLHWHPGDPPRGRLRSELGIAPSLLVWELETEKDPVCHSLPQINKDAPGKGILILPTDLQTYNVHALEAIKFWWRISENLKEKKSEA